MEDYIKFADEMAERAGSIMRKNFMLGMMKEWKEDGTPLTASDTTINDLIIIEVKKHFPRHGVLGEEDSFNADAEYLWVVDPVDGTMPFSQGIPTSVFSLALVRNGEAQVGVVEDPFAARRYLAVKGEGSKVNGTELRVSDQNELGSRTFVEICGHSRLGDFDAMKMLLDMDSKKTKVSKNFSAIYYSLPVATGQHAGSIIVLPYPWDGAALSLIVEEAGGKVTDFRGNRRKWNQPGDGIVLSNGDIHETLLKVVQDSSRK